MANRPALTAQLALKRCEGASCRRGSSSTALVSTALACIVVERPVPPRWQGVGAQVVRLIHNLQIRTVISMMTARTWGLTAYWVALAIAYCPASAASCLLQDVMLCQAHLFTEFTCSSVRQVSMPCRVQTPSRQAVRQGIRTLSILTDQCHLQMTHITFLVAWQYPAVQDTTTTHRKLVVAPYSTLLYCLLYCPPQIDVVQCM